MLQFLPIFLLCAQVLWAEADPAIFRAYDIRGIVGQEFAVEDSADLAASIATYLREQNPSLKAISLGADGRVHSPAIKEQVKATLQKYGFHVLDIGTCTTPVMYFSMHTLPVGAGLMITASHNPGKYNGIKIRLGTEPLNSDAIERIREIYMSKAFTGPAKAPGACSSVDLISSYVDHLVAAFPHLVNAQLKVLVDCGNGAAGTVLPLLIQKMQWKNMSLLYPEVDGTFPHHEADPSLEANMKDLKAALASSGAEIGLAFDGDCDRMAPMTKAGRLVKGDELVTLFSRTILEEHPGSAVVFDISSSAFLHDVVRQWGGKPVLSKTGVAAVKKAMVQASALIGGEISCHTVFTDRYLGFDDGMYSMLRLFEMVQECSLEEHLNDFPSWVSSPTYRLPCERSVCLEIVEDLKAYFSAEEGVEVITLDGIRVHFPQGWAIVRASGTEPVISMRFEGRTTQDLNELCSLFYGLVHPRVESWELLKMD